MYTKLFFTCKVEEGATTSIQAVFVVESNNWYVFFCCAEIYTCVTCEAYLKALMVISTSKYMVSKSK